MDLTPIIFALKVQIDELQEIVNQLEYQQLLNKAVSNAKNKQNETDYLGTKRNH